MDGYPTDKSATDDQTREQVTDTPTYSTAGPHV